MIRHIVIQTVFFDLGNVLLFFDHQKMYRQIAEFCQIPLELILTTGQKILDPYERGAIDSRKIHLDLCQLSSKPLEFKGLMHAMSDIFQLNNPMVDLVKNLKRKGINLFLLSNTCEAHFNFAYTHYPVLHLFDGYVLSYEVGARKPEKKIFEHALSMAKASPRDCFYVDDIPEYVDAAKTLNIDAELFTNHEQLSHQLALRGLL